VREVSSLFFVVLILCILPTTAEAQLFYPRIEYGVDDRPYSVANGDLDGDQDLAVANRDSHRYTDNVSVLINATTSTPYTLSISSNPEINVLIDVDPDPYWTTPFANDYGHGTAISLIAPQTWDNHEFLRWQVDGVDQPDGQLPLPITMAGDHSAVALYQPLRMVWYVDDDCTYPGSGTLEDPFCTIQAGIDIALDGDTVLVMPGTYIENIDLLEKSITLRSDTDGDPITEDGSPETTIIDGDAAGYVVTLEAQWGDDVEGTLDGFTIRNGSGSGIYCNEYAMIIRNCRITGNAGGGFLTEIVGYFELRNTIISDNTGHGIYGRFVGHFTIMDCIFSGNGGTGIYGGVAGITIENSLFLDDGIYYNALAVDGLGDGIINRDNLLTITDSEFLEGRSGINCANISVNMTNCRISGTNGGVSCHEGNWTLTNCIISNNTGTGVYCGFDSRVTINNCSITGNSGYEINLGGGSYCRATITNSIIWGDASPGQTEIYIHNTETALASYSDIQMENPGEVWPGTGNINADPLFVVGSGGDYYLSQIASSQGADSPCLNTGSDLAANICFDTMAGTICLDQLTTRTDQATDTGQVDMGCHYSRLSTVSADLTCEPASGILPFTVDICMSMENNSDNIRVVAGMMTLTLANGYHLSNWRTGYSTLSPLENYSTCWYQIAPEMYRFVGPNIIHLSVEDVTFSPYNQPPFLPSGDTATASCTVTGIAP